MSPRYIESYESDTTPSRAVIERYRVKMGKPDGGDASVSLALVHYRSNQEELDLGIEYCASADPLDRATGADVLAQLGWSDQTFLAESVEILIRLLSDPAPEVISSAAFGLGHRGDAAAIPHLLPLVAHPDSRVRRGVVSALSKLEDASAITALTTLCTDIDEDVRSWAVFGLGSIIKSDTSEIREALMVALQDAIQEIRGEALVGLALRKDDRTVDAILKEWEDDPIGILSIEAAEEIADARLLPDLRSFLEILDWEHNPYFHGRLLNAIAACGGGSDLTSIARPAPTADFH